MVRNILVVVVMTAFISGTLLANDYTIRPGDTISIEVWDEKDLSGKFKVTPEEELIINWLDPIKTEGLTLEKLKEKILAILKGKYVKNPIIKNIAVNEEVDEISTVGKGVTVVGAIKKEGVYKHREGYSVMAAILDAGGFTKFAAKNRTYLIRGKGEKRKKYLLKMGDVMDKGHKKKDMLLKPGDMVIVKEGFL